MPITAQMRFISLPLCTSGVSVVNLRFKVFASPQVFDSSVRIRSEPTPVGFGTFHGGLVGQLDLGTEGTRRV